MTEPPADQLRRLRRARGLSQLHLATAAGTSQRHLSFVESGRARPGPELLTRLAAALSLTMAERNALFEGAGLLPPAPDGPLRQDAYAAVRQAAWRLIEQQRPYPAMLLDARYDLLAVNPPLERLFGLLDLPSTLWPGTPQQPANLLRLSFHRDGLVRYMDAPEGWVSSHWQRIRRDARCPDLLDEIEAWPHLQAWLREPPAPPGEPALLERYRLDGVRIALLSMMTTPGVPTDITAGSMRINLLFPADAVTDDWLRRLDG